MVDNVNFNEAKGTFSMFSLKERPWHGLGTIVQEAPNSEQAIKLANLDFEVAKGKGFVQYSSEDRLLLGTNGNEVDNTYFTYRRDNGVVLMSNGKALTKNYTIVQNTQAFDFFDTIVGSKEAIFETAGALGKGEVIFITAKLPNHIRIKNTDDIIEQYLLFTSAHDGSGTVKMLFTPIRVVCNNTLNMAIKGSKNTLSFKHTRTVHDKLDKGIELLNLHNIYITELNTIFNRLADVNINVSDVTDIAMELILSSEELHLVDQAGGMLYKVTEISTKKKNIIQNINHYVESGVGQELSRGSALWLYNGISSFYNNGINYKSQEDKLDSIMEGHSRKQVQGAFNLITDKFLN